MASAETTTLEVSRFDMDSVKDGDVILLLGARGTGKTTLALDCLYFLRKYPLGVVMAGNLDTSDTYKQRVPDMLIFDKYESSKVEAMIKSQSQRLKRIQKTHTYLTPHERKALLKPVFLLLDDLMHEQEKINRCTAFKNLMLNGRHFKITVIICAQYVMNISKGMRGQIDYVFTTFQQDPAQRRQILDNFNVGFPNAQAFHATMIQCTDDYRCMVMSLHCRARSLIQRVFYHKANPARHNFRIGTDALWELNDRHYNPCYDDDDQAVSNGGDNDQKGNYVVRRIADHTYPLTNF